jgi:hypothetical protein
LVVGTIEATPCELTLLHSVHYDLVLLGCLIGLDD